MSNKKTQFGQSLKGDFEKNTWTFEMLEDFKLTAGDFAILPKIDFEVLTTLIGRLKLAISQDEKAKKLLEIEVVEKNVLMPIKLVELPNGETVCATKEGVEHLNSANTNYHEEDVHEEATKGLSTRHKANTPAVKKELTWDDIMNEYTTTCLIGEPVFLSFLKDNFNVPTRKL